MDEVAVRMNEEKVKVCLEVVMIVEERLELLGEDDLWAVVASAKNGQPRAEIDDSLQEQEQMKLVLMVGFGVSSQELGFEIHLLDPVNQLGQAIMELTEHLTAEMAVPVLTAEHSVIPLAELLEPRSKHFFHIQISTNERL